MEEKVWELDDLLEQINKDILGESDDIRYIGTATIACKDLEKLKKAKRKAKIRMIGTLTFSEDVTPELVRETIASVSVRGKINASIGVREALYII